MPGTDQPTQLVAASKCFACLTDKQNMQVQTYILAMILGGSVDPATLLNQSKCMSCLTSDQLLQIQTYLLWQLAP